MNCLLRKKSYYLLIGCAALLELGLSEEWGIDCLVFNLFFLSSIV